MWKNVPGRKSDVSDCQWIQYLHSVGLLKASFGRLTRSAYCALFGVTERASYRWQLSIFSTCRRL